MGYFQCLSGSLFDTSYCIGAVERELSVKQCVKVTLSISVEFDRAPSMEAIRYSVASALGVMPSLVHKISWGPASRRLSRGLLSSNQAAGNYIVALEVITPDNVSSVALVALASDLATPGSVAQSLWSQSLSETFGIAASHLSYVTAPISFQSVMITDSKGVVWGGSKPATVPTTPNDEVDNIGGDLVIAMIGGIVGCILALVVLIYLAVYGINRMTTQKFEV